MWAYIIAAAIGALTSLLAWMYLIGKPERIGSSGLEGRMLQDEYGKILGGATNPLQTKDTEGKTTRANADSARATPAGAVAVDLGAAVAAGKTRYIMGISIWNADTAFRIFYFQDDDAAPVAKWDVGLAANGQYGENGGGHPLFKISAGRKCQVLLDGAVATNNPTVVVYWIEE